MGMILPNFQQIDPTTIEPTIRQLLTEHRQKLTQILSPTTRYSWENLMQPLEDMNDELSKFWSPVNHLNAVMQSDALRKAYNDVLPLLTEYHTELSQNETLFKAIASLMDQPDFKILLPAQQKIIENEIRDFKLAGIHLPADKKLRLAELQQQYSQLTTKFSENLLDATHAWTLHITNAAQLDGLPPHALQLAIDNAKQRNLDGYVLTLDYPSYSTAIKFLKNRELRRALYQAYITRASDVGPNAGKWDNSNIMQDILKVRHEIAQLVGFDTYAHYSLATKMAKTPDEVLTFLNDLVTRSKPIAKNEYQDILKEAAQDGVRDLEVSDVSYYSEKLQMTLFDFSQEDFRPYFPIDKVLNGLFSIVNKLYGITVRIDNTAPTWHPHVQFFGLYDATNTLRAGFYIDLYARPKKRDGAWMDECRSRRHLAENTLQLPVAFLTCNFMPPADDNSNQPALLTHDDVLTLFHEFGHCLHHMLTKVNYPAVGGINGVPWDAVEFPSQFMENFCWEKESLDLISGHYQTNTPLPTELFEKLVAAKNFQTGLQLVRQLEFSLFDFRLHLEFNPNMPGQIQTVLDQVRSTTGVFKVPAYNRFQHSFSHIFAGGYAAGYYSYKWAEVLSADAYAQFEENGLFDRKTGKSFMENILEVGGVREPMASFIAFRGRRPTIDALLKHSGIEYDSKNF